MTLNESGAAYFLSFYPNDAPFKAPYKSITTGEGLLSCSLFSPLLFNFSHSRISHIIGHSFIPTLPNNTHTAKVLNTTYHICISDKMSRKEPRSEINPYTQVISEEYRREKNTKDLNPTYPSMDELLDQENVERSDLRKTRGIPHDPQYHDDPKCEVYQIKDTGKVVKVYKGEVIE